MGITPTFYPLHTHTFTDPGREVLLQRFIPGKPRSGRRESNLVQGSIACNITEVPTVEAEGKL